MREAQAKPMVAVERMVTIMETQVVMIERSAIGSIEVTVKKGKVGRKEGESGIEAKRGGSGTTAEPPLKRVRKGSTAGTVHTATLQKDKAKMAMDNQVLAAKVRGSLGTEEEGLDQAPEMEMAQLVVKMGRRFLGHVIATGTKHFLHMTQRRKKKIKMENLLRRNIEITDPGTTVTRLRSLSGVYSSCRSNQKMPITRKM